MTTTVTTTSTVPVIQEPVRKESHVIESSLRTLIGNRPIVLSYGYTNAGWNETNEAMKRILGEEGVWNYTVGMKVKGVNDPTTGQPMYDEHGGSITVPITHTSSSGNEVAKITVREAGPEGVSSETTRGTIKARRECKAGLINTIFHNYRMNKNEIDDFVPIIFPISRSYADGSPKAIEKNSRTTCAEIEVLRKLCTDEDLPEDFREMARKSVKFVDVRDEYVTDICEDFTASPDFVRQTTYSFTEVDAPWADTEGYAAQRAQVKATWLGQNPQFERPVGSKGAYAPQAFRWKEQVVTLTMPGMGYIPDPDEIELEAQEEQTVGAPVEVAPEFVTPTPTTQEEPTSSVPVKPESATVLVSEE